MGRHTKADPLRCSSEMTGSEQVYAWTILYETAMLTTYAVTYYVVFWCIYFSGEITVKVV